MPKTTYPESPAAVAAAVLDRIEQYPEMFHMDSWATLPSGVLEPGGEIECGTTMCIAGWAAHLTGYALHSTPEGEGVFAVKRGHSYEVETVAAEALGLDHGGTGIFWGTDTEALEQLREIADL